jgi:hypothetical protein
MSMSRQNAKRAELILVSSTIYSDDAAEVSKFNVFVIHDTLQIIESKLRFRRRIVVCRFFVGTDR